MLWYYQKSAADSDLNSDTDRNYKDAVAIFNGGGIRAPLYKGDVTKRSIFEVIPYGNTICGVKVTGKQLLEVLEASTFCTPDPVGGFPQIAGMKITIDAWKEFDKGDLYPKTTFHRPNSINRVTINEINGKPFDKNATYVVVTGNFCADGGDTYYVLANCERFDTGYTVEYAVGDYVTSELGGVIGSAYAAPKDRITVFTTKKDAIKNIKNQKVKGLKITAKKGGKAAVSYKSLGSGYKYVVTRSTRKSSGYKTVATTGKTKITVKGMKKGKTYYYRVKAYKTVDGAKVYTKAGSAVKVKAK
jgi:hypothetical protein